MNLFMKDFQWMATLIGRICLEVYLRTKYLQHIKMLIYHLTVRGKATGRVDYNLAKQIDNHVLAKPCTWSVTMYSQLRCVRTFRKCSLVFAVLIVAKATAWAMYLLLSQFFKPLLGRTRSRGKCWAAIRLFHRPEPSGRAVHEEFDGLENHMVEGLFFCTTLPGRRGGHTRAETSHISAEPVKPDPRCSWKGDSWGVGAGVRDESA